MNDDFNTDDLAAARGVANGCALSLLLWLVAALIVWWLL